MINKVVYCVIWKMLYYIVRYSLSEIKLVRVRVWVRVSPNSLHSMNFIHFISIFSQHFLHIYYFIFSAFVIRRSAKNAEKMWNSAKDAEIWGTGGCRLHSLLEDYRFFDVIYWFIYLFIYMCIHSESIFLFLMMLSVGFYIWYIPTLFCYQDHIGISYNWFFCANTSCEASRNTLFALQVGFFLVESCVHLNLIDVFRTTRVTLTFDISTHPLVLVIIGAK